MTTAPFSLLLPTYAGDSADFFVRAFESSVMQQALRPEQVVIVRDGPVDAELSAAMARMIAESPVDVELVEIDENRGLAHALTLGLAACRHEVVARMDADDISEPQRFQAQWAAIQEHDIVGTGMVEFVEDTDGERTTHLRLPPVLQEDIERYARFHDPFNHPTVMYRRSAVEAAGGYQPLGLMEDYWLFARMLAAGARATNVPLPLVRYRVSSGAYKRRGGMALLSSEVSLQRAFRRSGFTSAGQFARNLVVRGGYRLVPMSVRRVAYRRVILGRRWATTGTQ